MANRDGVSAVGRVRHLNGLADHDVHQEANGIGFLFDVNDFNDLDNDQGATKGKNVAGSNGANELKSNRSCGVAAVSGVIDR